MSVPADLIARVLELEPNERAELAHVLLTSLDTEEPIPPAEWKTAWAAEIERRIQEIDEGRAVLVPREEVEARLRATLERVRDERSAAPGHTP